MTPDEARKLIEEDAGIDSYIWLPISVLEEAAMLEERERCLQVIAKHADKVGAIDRHLGDESAAHEHRKMVLAILKMIEEAVRG